jgi:hypothetical protein
MGLSNGFSFLSKVSVRGLSVSPLFLSEIPSFIPSKYLDIMGFLRIALDKKKPIALILQGF